MVCWMACISTVKSAMVFDAFILLIFSVDLSCFGRYGVMLLCLVNLENGNTGRRVLIRSVRSRSTIASMKSAIVLRGVVSIAGASL